MNSSKMQRNVTVPAASFTTLQRRELENSVAAEFRHHCQGLARCRDIRINILHSPPPRPPLQALFVFYMWLSLKGLATSSGIIASHNH